MKSKISSLFLLLSQLLLSQNHEYENYASNFLNQNAISIVLGYIFIIITVVIVSYIETFNKSRTLFKSEYQNGLIELVIISFIGFIILFVFFMKNNDYGLYRLIPLIAIIIKFVMASVTSNKAEKLGRNKILWWILGFLEYHTALIILAIRPAILKTNGVNKTKISAINKDFTQQENSLIELYNAKLLNEAEFGIKYGEIKKKYRDELENFAIKDSEDKNKIKNNELLQKLNKAYDDGLLTAEEFEMKQRKLTDKNNY